jgi:hypothetical protein
MCSMEEQQDKDCYTRKDEIYYVIAITRPKSESIMKRLNRSKDRKKLAIEKKLEKDL